MIKTITSKRTNVNHFYKPMQQQSKQKCVFYIIYQRFLECFI